MQDIKINVTLPWKGNTPPTCDLGMELGGGGVRLPPQPLAPLANDPLRLGSLDLVRKRLLQDFRAFVRTENVQKVENLKSQFRLNSKSASSAEQGERTFNCTLKATPA